MASSILYKAPDLIRWLDPDLQSERKRPKADGGFRESIKQAASAAAGFGRTAVGEYAFRKAAEASFLLDDEGFEIPGVAVRRRIAYREASELKDLGKDKYCLTAPGGDLIIQPVAHLVAGPVRAPIGWLRNGVEVPYLTLIQELAARCRLDIIQAQ